MDRRTFVVGIASAFAAHARAQAKVARIAFFYFSSRQSALDTGRYQAFEQGMRELAPVKGRDLAIESYYADSDVERARQIAADLQRSSPDVIVASGGPVYRALKDAGNTVPVVVTVGADPVRTGLAASIARPGGTFTGLTDAAEGLVPKQLELLREALPRLSRVGALLNPTNESHRRQGQLLASAGRDLGVKVVQAEVSAGPGLESSIASLAKARADAFVMFGDTFFVQSFGRIAQIAIAHRLPSIYVVRQYPEAGGLMSYGPDISENFRRAATYVDRLLKGAKPGELPFEHPTKYELAINGGTARVLGLDLPQALVSRADHVFR